MKRLLLHVSVDNLAVDSVKFYSGMFASEPTVVNADYAKWMLDAPCVNFAISARGAQTALNQLGIPGESANELSEMPCRLNALQSDIEKEEGVACCYAKPDKYWVMTDQGLLGKPIIPLIPSQSLANRTKRLPVPKHAAPSCNN